MRREVYRDARASLRWACKSGLSARMNGPEGIDESTNVYRSIRTIGT